MRHRFLRNDAVPKPINPYRYGNNYKEQGEGGADAYVCRSSLPVAAGLSLRICAHIVLHDLLNSSAEPTCLPKGQHVAMLAGYFSFINLDFFERDDALAHRFENHTALFHLVETGEQFAGDLLELVFSVVAERGPELMQAVMLRR